MAANTARTVFPLIQEHVVALLPVKVNSSEQAKVGVVIAALLVAASNVRIREPPLLANLALANAGAGLAVSELMTLTDTRVEPSYCAALTPLGSRVMVKVPDRVAAPDSTKRPARLLLVEVNAVLAGSTERAEEATPFTSVNFGVTVTAEPGAEDRV